MKERKRTNGNVFNSTDKNKLLINIPNKKLTRIETDFLAKVFKFLNPSDILSNNDIMAFIKMQQRLTQFEVY